MDIQKLDPSTLPGEVTEFCPVECFDCEFDGDIPQDFFRVKPRINSEQYEKNVSEYLKTNHGLKKFSVLFSDEGTIITTSKCPNCGSDDIIVDI